MKNGDGAYIQYYPQGGGKRMELNAGNMIYYNNDGTVAWTLGAMEIQLKLLIIAICGQILFHYK